MDINDLSPELQEKARACGSVEELLALAKEKGVEIRIVHYQTGQTGTVIK